MSKKKKNNNYVNAEDVFDFGDSDTFEVHECNHPLANSVADRLLHSLFSIARIHAKLIGEINEMMDPDDPLGIASVTLAVALENRLRFFMKPNKDTIYRLVSAIMTASPIDGAEELEQEMRQKYANELLLRDLGLPQ